MAGMQGLGRVLDVVHDASGNMFTIKNASAVTFISKSSGSNTLTLVAAKTFGGSTTNWTTANGFGQVGFYYENTSATGTAAWTKQTSSWSSNVLTLGTSGKVDVVTIYTSQFADAYQYIQGTAAAGDLIAILHDLTVQRTPPNMTLLGA